MKRFFFIMVVLILIMGIAGGGILLLAKSTDILQRFSFLQSGFLRSAFSSVGSSKVLQSALEYANSSYETITSFDVTEIFSKSPQGDTSYYVDFAGGSDSNDGKSPSTPFKHCPGDKNAKERAGKIRLKPGDKAIFKGGVVYKGAISIKRSGQTNKEIVYDGNSSNTFGTGKAILDGDKMAYTEAFKLVKRPGFVIIKNFEISGYGKYGIYIHTATNVTIKDCHIHRISDWNLANCSASGCNLGYVHELGVGIQITSSQNILVDGCNVERTGHSAIKIQGNAQDVEVKNCDVHDYIHWLLDISPLKDTDILANISVHDSKFRELYHYASSWWTSWKGGGAHPEDEKVHPGVDENPHLDGIFVRNPMQGTMSNVRIYNNEFYNEKSFNENAGTAMLYVSEPKAGDSVYIYNNIFRYCPMHQAVYIYAAGGEVHLYNNTFYMQENGALRISETEGFFYIMNNIFQIDNGLVINMDNKKASGGLKSDYNIFKTGGKRFMYNGAGGWISDLDEWQKATRQDGNSKMVDDVKFVSTGGQVDLRPQNSSLAVNKGADLSKFFDFDKEGIKRPQGRLWDIGAYENKE